MKCIIVFALFLAAANAAYLPLPYYARSAYYPYEFAPDMAPKVLIEDGVKTKLVLDAPIAPLATVPLTYGAPIAPIAPIARYAFGAPIAAPIAPLVVPGPIAVGVPKATYKANNHGVIHEAALDGHFESVMIENNDEAPKMAEPEVVDA